MIISSKLLPRERPGEHGQQGGLCVRMDKTAQGSHTPNSSGPRDADRLRHAEDEGAHRRLRRGAVMPPRAIALRLSSPGLTAARARPS